MATRKKVAGKATTRSTKNNLTSTERATYMRMKRERPVTAAKKAPPKKKAAAKTSSPRRTLMKQAGASGLSTPRAPRRGQRAKRG